MNDRDTQPTPLAVLPAEETAPVDEIEREARLLQSEAVSAGLSAFARLVVRAVRPSRGRPTPPMRRAA